MAETASISLAEAFGILHGFAVREQIISPGEFHRRLGLKGVDIDPREVSELMSGLAEAGYIEFRKPEGARLGHYYLIPGVAPPEPKEQGKPVVPEPNLSAGDLDIGRFAARIQQNPRFRVLADHVRRQTGQVASGTVGLREVIAFLDDQGGVRDALAEVFDGDEASERFLDEFSDRADELRDHLGSTQEQPKPSAEHTASNGKGGSMAKQGSKKKESEQPVGKIPDDVLREYGRITSSNIWENVCPSGSVHEFVQACDDVGSVKAACNARGIKSVGRFAASTESAMKLLRKHAADLDALSEKEQEEARVGYRKRTGVGGPSRRGKAEVRPKQPIPDTGLGDAPLPSADDDDADMSPAGDEREDSVPDAGGEPQGVTMALAAADLVGHVRALLELAVGAFSSPSAAPISREVQEALQMSAIKSAFTALTTKFLPILPSALLAEQAWEVTKQYGLVDAFRIEENEDSSFLAGVYLLRAALLLQGKNETVEELFAE